MLMSRPKYRDIQFGKSGVFKPKFASSSEYENGRADHTMFLFLTASSRINEQRICQDLRC
jgi:hypothetical protein